MPAHEPQRKPTGRPKRGNPPRKVMTLRIDVAHIEWMYKHLSRSIPISDFVNGALAARIEAEGRRR